MATDAGWTCAGSAAQSPVQAPDKAGTVTQYRLAQWASEISRPAPGTVRQAPQTHEGAPSCSNQYRGFRKREARHRSEARFEWPLTGQKRLSLQFCWKRGLMEQIRPTGQLAIEVRALASGALFLYIYLTNNALLYLANVRPSAICRLYMKCRLLYHKPKCATLRLARLLFITTPPRPPFPYHPVFKATSRLMLQTPCPKTQNVRPSTFFGGTNARTSL